MMKIDTINNIIAFAVGYTYNLAKVVSLYLAVFYFTVCRGDLEW